MPLSRHRYGNATADDFFGSLGEASGNPKVVPAMRTFTDQTGVPVVRCGKVGDPAPNCRRFVPSGLTV